MYASIVYLVNVVHLKMKKDVLRQRQNKAHRQQLFVRRTLSNRAAIVAAATGVFAIACG